jgi:hypothetical protein
MANVLYNDRQRLTETEMTIGDLKHLIEQLILQTSGGIQPEIPAARSVPEVLASMRRNLWTPPTDAPSNLALLREDRDR